MISPSARLDPTNRETRNVFAGSSGDGQRSRLAIGMGSIIKPGKQLVMRLILRRTSESLLAPQQVAGTFVDATDVPGAATATEGIAWFICYIRTNVTPY